MSFKINKQNKIRKDVCVSLFSCVCQDRRGRGESSPTQSDGIHSEYTRSTFSNRHFFIYIPSFLISKYTNDRKDVKNHTHKAILWSFVDVTSLYHSLLISQFLKGKISQEQINRRKPSKQSNLQIIQIIICINSPHINVKQLIKWNLHNDLSHPDQ